MDADTPMQVPEPEVGDKRKRGDAALDEPDVHPSYQELLQSQVRLCFACIGDVEKNQDAMNQPPPAAVSTVNSCHQLAAATMMSCASRMQPS